MTNRIVKIVFPTISLLEMMMIDYAIHILMINAGEKRRQKKAPIYNRGS